MKSRSTASPASVVALHSVAPGERAHERPGRGAESRLLATKLFVPVTRAACVPRPRLQQRLEQGSTGQLTLLSAAAGSGKTTLVASWLRGREGAVAWFSLDERDNDVTRFFRYFVAAIARVQPGFGAGLVSDPQRMRLDDPLDLATDLVNELAGLAAEIVVVLDDFHVIDTPEVTEIMGFVIEAAPPNVQVVITTRVDPSLPLSRLRARGLLTEIRAPDLRFTADESAAFLREVMGLKLSEAQIERLEARTEGWAVGLQMAALSLQGRDDAAAFIEGFAGSHRYVLDYLMDEVLQRLPDSSRTFLMQTSILRQLTGPLVDAVTGRDDGDEVLRTLERNNLFLVPLDGHRTAYRYHHLFGTLLHHELESSLDSAARRELHLRASKALEDQGHCEEAVDHALLAGAYERAQRLLIPLVMGSTIRGEGNQLSRMIERFPPQQLEARPTVTLLCAWLDFHLDRFERVRAQINRIRTQLESHRDPELVAELDLLSGMTALQLGDIETAERMLPLLDALPEDRPYLISFKYMHRACVSMMQDRLEEAHRDLEDVRRVVPDTQDPFATLWVQWQAAHVDLLLGRLEVSRRAHEQLLTAAMETYGHNPPSSTAAGFATALYLYLHLHKISRATELSEIASKWNDQGLSRHHGYVSCLLMPKAALQVQAVRGEDWSATIDQAIRHLDAMDQAAMVPRIESQRVRLALHARSGVDGRPHAERWLQTPGIRERTHEVYRPNPMPGAQLDQPLFVLARSLAACAEYDAARAVARECLSRARTAKRRVCELEASLLLAELEHDDPSGEPTMLEQAIALAAPAGIVGPFLEFERSALPSAIDLAEQRGHRTFGRALATAHAEVSRAAFSAGSPASRPAASPPPPPCRAPSIEDALSERELEVLQLVALGLSNAEASRKLFIAPSTVKKHLEHIYGKLGVNRRTQAVAKARTLGLIAS